jgi:hypothetical protein
MLHLLAFTGVIVAMSGLMCVFYYTKIECHACVHVYVCVCVCVCVCLQGF